ncbi:phosphatase domain-containing protein [Legionella sp. CNM-4043-24]|uniref:phosphatase domain-containing protein n=1 Tax=Legionella sp. CNM-4043-24 TaxID=3421646 RepID=UPI00403A85D6
MGSILLVLTLMPSASIACQASRDMPCVVKDSSKIKPVSSLRDTRMIESAYQGNTRGVSSLRASASSEPGEAGWQVVADYIQARTSHTPEQVLVLDLRQENHGYLNGKAITLCDKHNWLNLGLSLKEIMQSEQNWLNTLSSQEQIDNVLSPHQFRLEDFNSGKSIPVKSVISEADLLRQWRFHYLRLPVSDHRAAEDSIVDQFVTLIDSLPDNMWLHIHCRGGKGRTTAFLAMYDMLKNADKASFEDIIQRQAAIYPWYDLSQVDRGDPEVSFWYRQRYQFLSRFYTYARDRLAGYRGHWSEWTYAH